MSTEFSNVNLVLGNNGDGKTSLLEAIYVSLLGTPLNSFSRAGMSYLEITKDCSHQSQKPLINEGNTTIYNFSSTNNGRKHLTDDTKITIREAYLEHPSLFN